MNLIGAHHLNPPTAFNAGRMKQPLPRDSSNSMTEKKINIHTTKNNSIKNTGKGPEQTSQRRGISDWQVLEKDLAISDHWSKTNQTTAREHLAPARVAVTKTQKAGTLGRTWRSPRPPALLGGVYDGAAAAESGVEGPQTMTTRSTTGSRKPTWGLYPKGLKPGLHAVPRVMAASSSTVQVWKQPRCPSIEGQRAKKR